MVDRLDINMWSDNPTYWAMGVARNYTGSFGCSNEQIFTPVGTTVTLNGPSPGLQQPAQPVQLATGNFAADHVGPTDNELDPYFAFGDPRFNTDFQIVVHNSTTDNLSLPNSSVVPWSIRTTGLRAPMLLSGWGFGLDDTPVPAKGAFGDDKFKFAEGTPINRTLWKTGPIDLKWDDERQVWSGGPQFLEGKLTSDLTKGKLNAPTTATMDVYRREWDDTLGETVTLYNRDNSLEQKHEEKNDKTGTTTDLEVYVIAMRINYEWRPLWVGCPDDQDGQEKDDTTDDSSSSSSSSSSSDGGTGAGYNDFDWSGGSVF